MKQLLINLADRLYRLSNRLVPCDIAVIYLLELAPQRTRRKATACAGLEIRALSEVDLVQLYHPDMDFSVGEADQLWSTCECIGAFSGPTLVGYAWHADGYVSAELNTAGPPFQGCAMELTSDTQYLFKVFVHPAHRRQSINVAMCETLGDNLARRGYRNLVTLTDWNNRAFQRSIEPMGFRSIGHCTEWVFANRSRYKLPDHLGQIAQFSAP